MEKYSLLLVLLILFNLNLGCSNTEKEAERKSKVICKDIITSKTQEHQKFYYSKTYIIPPKGYIPVKDFGHYACFVKDSLNYIELSETGQSFEEIKKIDYDRYESYESRLCNIKLNNFEALMGEDFVVFGDENFTTKIYFYCLEDDTLAKKELIESLKSIYYDSTYEYKPNNEEEKYNGSKFDVLEKDPFLELTKFNIDLNKTEFKLAGVTQGISVYKSNDSIVIKKTEENFNKTLNSNIVLKSFSSLKFHNAFTVVHLPNKIVNSKDIENIIKESTSNIPEAELEFKQIGIQNAFTLNNLTCQQFLFELFVSKNKFAILYIFVVKGDSGYILFNGIAYNNFEKYYKLFPRVAKTLTFK